MTTGYLHIRKNETLSRDRVTDIYDVYSTRRGMKLGTIRWYGAWRQYTFAPWSETIYNPDCLREIADKCAELTKQHRDSARLDTEKVYSTMRHR